jgi:DNA-binding transcriptional ArsR family regulator
VEVGVHDNRGSVGHSEPLRGKGQRLIEPVLQNAGSGFDSTVSFAGVAKQLTQIVRGCLAVGMSRKRALALAIRCARDSIPPLRLEILLDVAKHPDSRPGDVRERINKPWRTTKREMEALNMLGLLRCEGEKSGGYDTDEKERTVWRYRLADGFDRATLLATASADEPPTRPGWG